MVAISLADATGRGRISAPTRLVRVRFSRPVIAVASTAVVLEVLWLATGRPLGWWSSSLLLPSLLIVPLLLIAARRAMPSQKAEAWRGCWMILAAVGLGLLVAATARHGVGATLELAAASFSEEVIYRFGLPIAVAAGLVWIGVPRRAALASGVAVSTIGFLLLPGHVAQMTDARIVAAFVGMTAIWTLIVWTSGAVAPVAVAHALVNVSSLAADATWHSAAQGVVVAVVLLALVHGAHRQQLAAA